VSATVILGLLLTLGATFVALALLVRTAFGRTPHPITLLPVPLVLYCLWLSAWFVFENFRQFLLTSVSPGTGLRIVAFIFLVAALLLVGFVYSCLAAVHQFLGGKASRVVRRIARVVAPVFVALLIMGWSGYHYNGDTVLFTMLRRIQGRSTFPIALAAWVWLLLGARAIEDVTWRRRVVVLARFYVALFAVILVASVARDRLEAVTPLVPLVADVFLALVYALITVMWVEPIERAARHRGTTPNT